MMKCLCVWGRVRRSSQMSNPYRHVWSRRQTIPNKKQDNHHHTTNAQFKGQDCPAGPDEAFEKLFAARGVGQAEQGVPGGALVRAPAWR